MDYNNIIDNMEMNDWSTLDFGYRRTKVNTRCYFKDGQWGELFDSTSEEISLHMAATCLHYGQEAFDGLKAFSGKDGKVRVFRMSENAKRLQNSARGIGMQEVPIELFERAIINTIKKNIEQVPPYGSGASLYIRPLLIGTGPQVGVKPAKEFLFLVFVTPVGPYFKEGFKPTPMVIMRDYDRAAPLGTGSIKIGGNYAASIVAGERAHEKGYSAVLFLDAKEKKYIDECGPANFFGIKNNTYITPESPSILPSITNKSLCQLAADMGLKVERRKIKVEELSTFEEAGACGTAAVISPIMRIDDADTGHQYVFCKDGKAGKLSTALYENLVGIQNGDIPDTYNWVTIIE